MNQISQKAILDESRIAGTNGVKMFHAVSYSGGKAVLPPTNGAPIRGVSMDGSEEGRIARIVTDGLVPIKIAVGAGVQHQSKLRANADGTFQVAVGGNAVAAIADIPDGQSVANGDIIQARVSQLIVEEIPNI